MDGIIEDLKAVLVAKHGFSKEESEQLLNMYPDVKELAMMAASIAPPQNRNGVLNGAAKILIDRRSRDASQPLH